ncbi:MAG: 3'-5' exonuclease [Oscillospiraceae bacterium]|nr:3'-5' exonuclease [Oscillospiraceae bacterium]
MKRFIAFDVETPNSANDRMSAIGVTVVENGMIVDELDTLVNPETWFHPFNVQLTGITPVMAEEAPTFPELWPILCPIFDSGILAAHNAPFDMSVLGKCLRAYGIDWKPAAEYVCTCQMGRRCFPELSNHKLNTLCAYLEIGLDHHQAGSDSRACASILMDCMDRTDWKRFRRTYDLIHLCTLKR